MPWVDPGVVEARVRRLGSDDLAAFVADLWAARGFATTREGASVSARRDGQTQVVYVLTGRATTPPGETITDVDVVVATGRPQAGERLAAELGARCFDAGDLTGMLRYAVGRDVAADLCETHLGAAPDALRFPLRRRVRRAVVGREAGVVTAVIVASLIVAVGGGVVLGLVPGSSDSGTTADAAVTSETPTDVDGDGAATETAASTSLSGTVNRSDPSAVPGVSYVGISDADRLAQAHAAVVSDASSYTVWFDYHTSTNGSDERVKYDVDVRVQGERSVARTSLERTGGTRVLLNTVYANSTGRYAAEDNRDRLSRLDNRTPTATPRAVRFTGPAEMIRTYLDTPKTAVATAGNGTAGERYRLHGTGRPAALPDTVTDYEMTAIVDERGFVRTFEAEFSVRRDTGGDGGGRDRVRLTWTYGRVNATDVRLGT